MSSNTFDADMTDGNPVLHGEQLVTDFLSGRLFCRRFAGECDYNKIIHLRFSLPDDGRDTPIAIDLNQTLSLCIQHYAKLTVSAQALIATRSSLALLMAQQCKLRRSTSRFRPNSWAISISSHHAGRR